MANNACSSQDLAVFPEDQPKNYKLQTKQLLKMPALKRSPKSQAQSLHMESLKGNKGTHMLVLYIRVKSMNQSKFVTSREIGEII